MPWHLRRARWLRRQTRPQRSRTSPEDRRRHGRVSRRGVPPRLSVGISGPTFQSFQPIGIRVHPGFATATRSLSDPATPHPGKTRLIIDCCWLFEHRRMNTCAGNTRFCPATGGGRSFYFSPPKNKRGYDEIPMSSRTRLRYKRPVGRNSQDDLLLARQNSPPRVVHSLRGCPKVVGNRSW